MVKMMWTILKGQAVTGLPRLIGPAKMGQHQRDKAGLGFRVGVLKVALC